MAYEQSLMNVTAKAGSAINKYYFMELSTSVEGQVDEANAATDKAYGVSQQSADAAGDSVDVMITGITKVVAGAAISLGDYVGPSSAGKAVTKSVPGQRARGIALQAASADGDIISILLVDVLVPGTHAVIAAGNFTTEGGDAAEQATVAGVLATDIVIASLETEGASPVTLDAAATATDAINFTMSGDPSTDHILSYVVLRAVA